MQTEDNRSLNGLWEQAQGNLDDVFIGMLVGKKKNSSFWEKAVLLTVAGTEFLVLSFVYPFWKDSLPSFRLLEKQKTKEV